MRQLLVAAALALLLRTTSAQDEDYADEYGHDYVARTAGGAPYLERRRAELVDMIRPETAPTFVTRSATRCTTASRAPPRRYAIAFVAPAAYSPIRAESTLATD